MKLIKLNAIDSTNEYIKLNKSLFSQNSLVVYSFNQTNGKGQRGKIWSSHPYKTICISFYNKIEKTEVKTGIRNSGNLRKLSKSFKYDDTDETSYFIIRNDFG